MYYEEVSSNGHHFTSRLVGSFGMTKSFIKLQYQMTYRVCVCVLKCIHKIMSLLGINCSH